MPSGIITQTWSSRYYALPIQEDGMPRERETKWSWIIYFGFQEKNLLTKILALNDRGTCMLYFYSVRGKRHSRTQMNAHMWANRLPPAKPADQQEGCVLAWIARGHLVQVMLVVWFSIWVSNSSTSGMSTWGFASESSCSSRPPCPGSLLWFPFAKWLISLLSARSLSHSSVSC